IFFRFIQSNRNEGICISYNFHMYNCTLIERYWQAIFWAEQMRGVDQSIINATGPLECHRGEGE
ncbi:MAG: hypothetical protein ACQEUB_13365, partial [Thermodesulfobacteriota bacterium]